MAKVLSEKGSKGLLVAGIVLLIIGVVLFLWQDWSINSESSIKSDKVGQFGDFVGGVVGSLWALAGVILFYVALKEQRGDFKTNKKVLEAQTKALEQQIEEFKLQVEELQETRKVFNVQSETLKKQQFESTFFNLLGNHHQIVNTIDLRIVKGGSDIYRGITQITRHKDMYQDNEKEVIIYTGRDCFVLFRKYLMEAFNFYEDKNLDVKDEHDRIQVIYKDFYHNHQSDLGHYFRNLYHIFKFIHNSDEAKKKMYTSIVRAQLSNDELFMIFYNCLSQYGDEKFKPLIEEYQLLKNLNKESLINYELHAPLYKKSAFED